MGHELRFVDGILVTFFSTFLMKYMLMHVRKKKKKLTNGPQRATPYVRGDAGDICRQASRGPLQGTPMRRREPGTAALSGKGHGFHAALTHGYGGACGGAGVGRTRPCPAPRHGGGR